MNTYLQQAYQDGQQAAEDEFNKLASGEDVGDVATPITGALNPLLAGVTSGVTAPKGHRLAAGFGAGLGSAGGMVAGGGLGALLGYGGGGLLRLSPEDRLALTLALAGIGTFGGGAYGAHKGRELGKK